MPLQTLSAVVGVAKQTARGSLAAQPTYAHGLSGGTPINIEASQTVLEVTSAKRVQSTIMREEVKSNSEVQSPAYMKTLGLWLLGALGTDTVTGTNPYVHTYSTGDLPYLSVFAKGVGADIQAIRDCKVDELSLKWDGSKPVELNVKSNGTVYSYPSTFTPTNDETGSTAFLIPTGGTFQIDVIGSTLATARVVSGEITIKNNNEQVDTSASIQPADIIEGIQEHNIKLTIVPDDLLEFRKIITGAGTGTSVSSTVPYGSLSVTFLENGGTGQLAITGSKIAYMTSLPDVNTKGGAVQIELAGTAVLPSGGTAPLVFALTNAVASY